MRIPGKYPTPKQAKKWKTFMLFQPLWLFFVVFFMAGFLIGFWHSVWVWVIPLLLGCN